MSNSIELGILTNEIPSYTTHEPLGVEIATRFADTLIPEEGLEINRADAVRQVKNALEKFLSGRANKKDRNLLKNAFPTDGFVRQTLRVKNLDYASRDILNSLLGFVASCDRVLSDPPEEKRGQGPRLLGS